MENEKELIEVDQQTALQIYTDGDVTGLLEDVKKKIFEATPENPDFSIKKIRDLFRTNAASVARAKTKFDGAGKSLTDEWKAKSKKVDNVRKFFRDSMDYFKAEYREPLTRWEEEKKQADEEAVKLVKYLADWGVAIADNDIVNREREVARKEAELAKAEEEREAAAEVERIEKERIEREEQIKNDAAENAKCEAEKNAAAEKEKILKREIKAKFEKEEAKRKLKEAEQRVIDDAKQAKIDQENAVRLAEQTAADEAARVERGRIETERIQREADEADRKRAEEKAADIEHQRTVNNQALHDLIQVDGVSVELGTKIVKAVASGKVDHISINY